MNEYKINGGLAQDVTKAIGDIKISEMQDKTFSEFMGYVRAHIGMTGFNTLDDSKEDELKAENKKLNDEIAALKKKIAELTQETD